jgi:excisionase family DNA binding protein
MSEEERLTYTVPEAGKLLGIGRRLAYEQAASGQLPIIRIGRRILVPRVALERMLAQPAQDLEERRHVGGETAGQDWPTLGRPG